MDDEHKVPQGQQSSLAATPFVLLFSPKLAEALKDLAVSYRDQNLPKEAKDTYDEALILCRSLAEEAPDLYFSSVAGVLENLASLYVAVGSGLKAREAIDESLLMYRQLAQGAPDTYLS